MRIVIFLGPSLSQAKAKQLVTAVYLPPASQGDLLSAVYNYEPDIIGLIDGVFNQQLSVWHKEILFALSRGIEVYGASSMGALRAAETKRFGMIGVGEIFRQYDSGELNDDDEVALLHGPADTEYVKFSEPMVNVRATLQSACRAGLMDEQIAMKIAGLAKSLFYTERTFEALYVKCLSEGIDAALIRKLADWTEHNYVDLKQQDALALLQAIQSISKPLSQRSSTFEFLRSYNFDTLNNRDRKIERVGTLFPLSRVAEVVALQHPCFGDLNFNALNRAIVTHFAVVFQRSVHDNDVERESKAFRLRKGLLTEDAFATWLVENDLTETEFADLMHSYALCKAMHEWYITERFMDRTCRPICDELRLRNEFGQWATRAGLYECANHAEARRPQMVAESGQLDVVGMLRDHIAGSECDIDRPYAKWAEEAGFHSEDELRYALDRARIGRDALSLILQRLNVAEHGNPSGTNVS